MNTKLPIIPRLISYCKLIVLAVACSVMSVSCSDSVTIVDDGTLLDDSADPSEPEGAGSTESDAPLFEVFTETGESGMRVTYSPASLTLISNVEQLEQVYLEVMECVGVASAFPPSMLLTTDTEPFLTRSDGTEIKGFYDGTIDIVKIHADDLSENVGNRYFWTRHGMIEYLMSVHGLIPDSNMSPFLNCHFPIVST